MMPHATTCSPGSTGENFPSGHDVNDRTHNVCWNWKNIAQGIARRKERDRAGIATGTIEDNHLITPLAIGAGIARTGSAATRRPGGIDRERECHSPATPGIVTIVAIGSLRRQKKPGAPTPDLLAIQ